MRLDKYLSDMGIGSRSQMREAVKKGRVSVNGVIAERPDQKVEPAKDEVTFDSSLVSYVKYEYYMLNKPKGTVSAVKDNVHRTVIELMEDRKKHDLFPVGRLDVDTEGLLLITNDGDLAHRLLSPSRHVDKVYEAVTEGIISEEAVGLFARGLTLNDGTKLLPADLEILETNFHQSTVRLTLREGKFHQVKRMLESVGCRVVYLKRVSMGNLTLDPQLLPGEYRPLTEQEIALLSAHGKEKTDEIGLP